MTWCRMVVFIIMPVVVFGVVLRVMFRSLDVARVMLMHRMTLMLAALVNILLAMVTVVILIGSCRGTDG